MMGMLRGAAGGIDGQARFWRLFEELAALRAGALPVLPADEALHRPKRPSPHVDPVAADRPFRQRFRLMLVPGLGASLVGGLGAPLPDAAAHLRTQGVMVETLEVSALAGSRRNAAQIARTIAGLEVRPDERLVLLGYSKGAMDALMALAEHPAVAARVDALVSFAGSIGGSVLVDELPDAVVGGLHRLRVWLPSGGLWSLRRRRRQAWLNSARFPTAVRLYSVAAHTARERISGLLRASYERLRLIDPRNDGQVLLGDQIIPGSTLLAELNCDHWAAALPLTRRHPWLRHLGLGHNDFPRQIVLEAVLRTIDHDLAAMADGTRDAGHPSPQAR